MANKAKGKVRDSYTIRVTSTPMLKMPRVNLGLSAGFEVGDVVRVTVELLERRKREGGK